MASESVIASVQEFTEPLLADMGLELVDIEYRREGHGWVLRFFIDKEGGVTLDDCAAVSREIGAYLEVEDPIGHAYNLEVSSPGLERPLKKKQDFERFAGRKARIKLREPIGEQRVFIGIIEKVDGESLLMQVDEIEKSFPLDLISKARLSL